MTEAAARVDHEPLIIGRYALFDALASGGMATVHLGRLLGAVGFGRTVAVKRLHAHYTTDQDFVTMFMDEARIVARIRHPNVVPMVDVIESSKGLFLVMEYVHGESFSRLLRSCRARKEAVPIKLVNAILHGVLLGLHAAHETKGASGELLDVVHRDVSPQNIIVGADGVARVLDFGVAKAAGRAQVTREGQIKGKLTYMAPEQIRGKVDRRADVFAAAVVLWEALAGRRLHEGLKDVEIVTRVIKGNFPRPSQFRSDIPPELEAITLRGLEIDPNKRYQNAREMALDIERSVGLASPSEVSEWVEALAKDALQSRAEKVAAMEKASSELVPIDSVPPPPDDEQPEPVPSDPFEAYPEATGPGEHSPSVGEAASSPSNPSLPSGSGIDVTGTAAGTELPVVEPNPSERRDLAPMIGLVSFLVALAIVGVLLGGWSLMARKAAPATGTPPISSPSSRVTSPPPSMAPSSSASPSSTTVAREPTARPGVTLNATAHPPSDPGAPTATTPLLGTPVRPSETTPPTPPPKKKECDPPYNVDESGHRKYKLECLATE